MATNFPTSLDTNTELPVESASTPLSTNHVINHTNVRDAVKALEAKVGIDNSSTNTSLDYKLSGVTGSDKSASLAGIEVLTNKTLTAPTITSPTLNLGSDAEGDTYYRNGAGALVRLAKGTDNYIYKMNGNVPNWEAEAVISNATSSAVGIVELATASEITAGTASGSAGPLAITPDQLALSTPVFNGSGLTNVGIYSINTSETLNTYSTYEVSIIPTSSSVVPGWTATTLNATSISILNRRLAGSATSFALSCTLPGSGAQYDYRIDEGKALRVKVRMRFPDLFDRKGFGFCITPANIYTAHTDTTNGEVRFILNASTMYAQNANGTATYTDVSSGITFTNWNLYEIIFTPGVDIKYYINGTLVATHTTNLPTSGTLLLTYGANDSGRQLETTTPVISIQN